MGFYNQSESGKALSVKDEGVTVDSNASELDFTGAGVTASQVSAGIVEVDISSGGGGGAPVDAEYYVASSNGSLTNEVVVTGLGTVNGIMKGNGSGTISSATAGTDYVTPTGTETLSNKTITSPVINVGSDATGDIYYRNSGGAFTRLGIGTNGQVLTLDSGLPSWKNASGGGGAPIDAEYYVASSNGTLTNEIVVTGLGTVNGIMKGNGSGAISSATAGTDYVTPTGTETLSNKTLTSPVINVTSDAGGDIYYRNSGGAFTRLGIGTSGQVLSVSAGGIPEWTTASGGSFSWNATASGTSGTGLTLTVGANSSSGTIAQEIIFDNTQTNAIVGLKIDTGTSALKHTALEIKYINGHFSSVGGAGILLNDYPTATQGVGGKNINSFRIGKNFNTNSAYDHYGVFIQNENNSGTGYNTGFRIDNFSQKVGLTGYGSGLILNQFGVDGNAIQINGLGNINLSTYGLVNSTLSNTQSGASIMYKIDTGTSAQGHIAHLVYMRNASTSARGYKFDGSTTFTGTAIELSGTTSTANAFEFGSAFYTSSAPVATTTQYINITISGTSYVLEAKSVA